jgi:Domain of Unknown Function (DUF1080)
VGDGRRGARRRRYPAIEISHARYDDSTVVGSRMKTLLACAMAVTVMPTVLVGIPQVGPASLFDGTTFNGWEGNLALFRIESGAIVAGTLTARIERNEFLCTTRRFKDFELRLRVKLLGGDQANAGVQFRTERIANHHEVIGFQADMGTGWWGALYDESRRKRVLQGPDQAKMKDVIRAGEWNDYTIRADGPRVQLSINGLQTVDYVETDRTVADHGLICVQIHSGPPSEAWYRDISIAELKQ